MSQRLRIGLNQHEMPFTIALVHPQIPPNTGNILRLCANTGALFCSVFLHSHLQWHNYGTTGEAKWRASESATVDTMSK